MRSSDIWAATVRIRSESISGTGVLIAAKCSNIDYVITALHNIDVSKVSSIQIQANNGDQLVVLDVSLSSDADIDIAILHVKKYEHTRRILVCSGEINYAHACSVGYPGALSGKQKQAVDYKGRISYDGSTQGLHFNIYPFPDPDIDKHDYITGFSGGGVFELSPCMQYVKLKAIIIERWEAEFDIKKVECIRISVVKKILNERNLPPFAEVVDNFASILEAPPPGLHDGLVKFIRDSPHVSKITSLETESVLRTITINVPLGVHLREKFRSLSSRAQMRFIEDVFSAKSISFAYYNDALEQLDLNSNPLVLGSNLNIVLCCVTDDTDAPLVICRLVSQDYQGYLKNSIVVVCHLKDSDNPPEQFSYPAHLTAAVIQDYTTLGSQLGRSDVKDVRNYLEPDSEEKRFSVFSVAALCYEIKQCLIELYYQNRSGFYDDLVFTKKIKDKLDATVKIRS
jgi:hypothetical protein